MIAARRHRAGLLWITTALASAAGCELIAGLKDWKPGDTGGAGGAGGAGSVTASSGTSSNGTSSSGTSSSGTGGTMTSSSGTGGSASSSGTGGSTTSSGTSSSSASSTSSSTGALPCNTTDTFTPTPVASGENTPIGTAVDINGNVYWANASTTNNAGTTNAVRWLKKGSAPATLVSLGTNPPLAVAADGTYAFWSQQRAGMTCSTTMPTPPDVDSVMSIQVSGSMTTTTYFQSCGKATALAQNFFQVFWVRPTSHRVSQAFKVGGMATEKTIYSDTMSNPFSVVADVADIFWSDTFYQEVRRCSTASSLPCTPVSFASLSSAASPYLALDTQTVYWTADNQIMKLDRTSGTMSGVQLASGVTPTSIALDPTYVYVTDVAGKVLRYCKKDGSVTPVATGQLMAQGVSVDTSTMPPIIYWATSNAIMSAQ